MDEVFCQVVYVVWDSTFGGMYGIFKQKSHAIKEQIRLEKWFREVQPGIFRKLSIREEPLK